MLACDGGQTLRGRLFHTDGTAETCRLFQRKRISQPSVGVGRLFSLKTIRHLFRVRNGYALRVRIGRRHAPKESPQLVATVMQSETSRHFRRFAVEGVA
jgi:hypothetical protein